MKDTKFVFSAVIKGTGDRVTVETRTPIREMGIPYTHPTSQTTTDIYTIPNGFTCFLRIKKGYESYRLQMTNWSRDWEFHIDGLLLESEKRHTIEITSRHERIDVTMDECYDTNAFIDDDPDDFDDISDPSDLDDFDDIGIPF